jgi:hypothetical protein
MKPATLGQASYVLDLLREKNVSSAKLQSIIDRGLLSDLIDADPDKIDRAKFRALLGVSYKVTLGYVDETLQTLIARGKYATVDENVSDQYFPIIGKGQRNIDIVLVPINKTATNKDSLEEVYGDVLAEIEKRGLRPARIEELLALAATYPEIEAHFNIIAMGSSCHINNERCVPILCHGYTGRKLLLIDSSSKAFVGHDECFAAVGK